MKNSLLRARYEAAEFLVADALLVLGGLAAGIAGPSALWQAVAGGVLVALGLFFGMRVLRRFSADLSATRVQIAAASLRLAKADRKAARGMSLLDAQRRETARLTRKLRATEQGLDRAIGNMERQSRNISQELEKIFGHTSAFSRSSWANPIDKQVEGHGRRIRDLEERVDRIGRTWRGT